MSDDFGDRMKNYEMREASRSLIPLLPIMIRLDGHGFSRYTKGLKRPYDKRLSTCMQQATAYLMDKCNAQIGYTQSDEISLVVYSDTYTSETYFNGRIQKLVSILASQCTGYFNGLIPNSVPEKQGIIAEFDCRVWNVPTLEEAVNTLLWREQDATKNSISMAARCYFSHKELYRKSGKEMQEMLFAKGINWNDYPRFFKRGSYFLKVIEHRKFSTEELARLPEKHAARTDPELVVERKVIKEIDLPKLSSIANRVDVLFRGCQPILRE